MEDNEFILKLPRPVYVMYRVVEMLISLVSRFLNACRGGSTHQTLSAAAYIEPLPRLQAFIDALFFLRKGHCRRAWKREVAEAKRTLAIAKVRMDADVANNS
jgi:hypothetical protein